MTQHTSKITPGGPAALNESFPLAYTRREARLYRRLTKDALPADTHLAQALQKIDIRGKDILDYGCGDGRLFPIFKILGARTVTGCDPSLRLIHFAQTEHGMKEGAQFDALTNQVLPYRERTFDIIVTHYVLHYVYHTDSLARQFFKIIRPGGYVVAILGEAVVKNEHTPLHNSILPLVFAHTMTAQTLVKERGCTKNDFERAGFVTYRNEHLPNASVAKVSDTYPLKKDIELVATLLVFRKPLV